MIGRLLVKAAGASGVLLLLRPRWKWLASCFGAALLCQYLYAEYVEYVRLLADMGDVDVLGSWLPAALIAKNAAIVLLALAYMSFEFRLAKRQRNSRTGADSAEVGRIKPLAKARRREVVDVTHESSPASPARDAATTTADDGFDFLRHGRKLRTRTEKIMRSE